MDSTNIQFIKDLSPYVAAVAVIFLIVRIFISYLEKKDAQTIEMIARFDSRLEAMSRSYFTANEENNRIIGNHIDHSTQAMTKQAESNIKLEVAINTLISIVAAITKKG